MLQLGLWICLLSFSPPPLLFLSYLFFPSPSFSLTDFPFIQKATATARIPLLGSALR